MSSSTFFAYWKDHMHDYEVFEMILILVKSLFASFCILIALPFLLVRVVNVSYF